MKAIIIGGEVGLVGRVVIAHFFSHAEKADGSMSVLYDTTPSFFRMGSEHLGGIKFYREHLSFLPPEHECQDEDELFTMYEGAV